MTDAQRLTIIRAIHTVIYVVMAASALTVLASAITGATGPWLWVAAGLTALESLVFAASGFKCPLTALAVKYGATKDGAWDTFFPERCTRYTFRVLGPVIGVGAVLWAWRVLAGG